MNLSLVLPRGDGLSSLKERVFGGLFRIQKEAQCGLAMLRLMGFHWGFLRWARRCGVVQFARGRERDDSESQEAVFFIVLQHSKMQPWATTASWSPFHLSRREIHTTTILPNRTILSSCSGPLHTRLKLNSFLASPSDSSGEPPASHLFLRPFLSLGLAESLGELIGTSLRVHNPQPLPVRGPLLGGGWSNLTRTPEVSVALK